MAGDVCFFRFWKGCLATLGDTLFLILGAFGIQNGFQTQVTKLPFFPNRFLEMLSWMLFLVRGGGVGGLSATLLASFWTPWGPNGVLFEGFWKSAGVLGCLGRAVCARTPWFLSRSLPF